MVGVVDLEKVGGNGRHTQQTPRRSFWFLFFRAVFVNPRFPLICACGVCVCVCVCVRVCVCGLWQGGKFWSRFACREQRAKTRVGKRREEQALDSMCNKIPLLRTNKEEQMPKGKKKKGEGRRKEKGGLVILSS